MITMLTFIRRFLHIGKEEKGFTLIELMVVVAILGILAAVAIPKFSTSTETAKLSRVRADLRTIESAISMYKIDYSDAYPPALTNLVPDYLQSVPKDPYAGVAYSYNATSGIVFYDGATDIYSYSE